MSTLSSLHGFGTTILSNLFIHLPVPQAVPGLSSQTIIVTGSNTGLGFETSRHLLRLGLGKLIMAVRSLPKGDTARGELLSSTGRDESSVEVWPLDMDSYDSIKAFARRASELPRLDGVLANAGLMTSQFSLSENHEKTLNVNVISTFLLCFLLIPKMRDSGVQTGNTCRFVIPNSALHYMAPFQELDAKDGIISRLDDDKSANMSGRYPLSKLLVIYAVRELAEKSRLSNKGGFIINTPNPSWCVSSLMRESDSSAARMAERLIARTTEAGSRTLFHGLIAGKESNGQYLTNCHVQTPARHVTGDWGQQKQQQFFEELVQELDRIEPGLSKNI